MDAVDEHRWHAYHKSIFPPGRLVTPWIRFKVMSTGVNIARRLWDQREELREAYEVEHGSDQDGWPHRHPGIVLTAVPSIAHGGCLGCQWFDVRGHWMGHADWFERACIWPHRHQVSDGVFLDGPRRWRGGGSIRHDDDECAAPFRWLPTFGGTMGSPGDRADLQPPKLRVAT